MEGEDPQMQASSTYVREKRRCVGARKGSHGMVGIKLLCFRWLSPFFMGGQKGFPGFANGQTFFSVPYDVSERGRGAMGWYRSKYCVSGGCLLSLWLGRRAFQDLLTVRPSSLYLTMCRSEEGEPWDGRDQNIVFQMAVSFLYGWAEGVSRQSSLYFNCFINIVISCCSDFNLVT